MPYVNHLSASLITASACLLASSMLAGCSQQISKQTLRTRGDHAMFVEHWTVAMDNYTELTDRDPTDWSAQANLGHAALEAGDLATARRSLEIASTLRPTDAAIARDLADTMQQQQAWDDLFAYLRDRAMSTSTSADWLRLARVAIEADDPDTAREAVRTALAVDADQSVGPYLMAARMLRRLGDDDEAQRTLALAWRIDPKNEDVRAALRDMGVVPGPTMRYAEVQTTQP